MGRKEQYIFHKGSGDHPRRIHQSGKGGNPPTWVDAVILGQWSDWERVIGNISNKRLWQWEWGQEDDFDFADLWWCDVVDDGDNGREDRAKARMNRDVTAFWNVDEPTLFSVLFRWQTYNVVHSTILHCSVEWLVVVLCGQFNSLAAADPAIWCSVTPSIDWSECVVIIIIIIIIIILQQQDHVHLKMNIALFMKRVTRANWNGDDNDDVKWLTTINGDRWWPMTSDVEGLQWMATDGKRVIGSCKRLGGFWWQWYWYWYINDICGNDDTDNS